MSLTDNKAARRYELLTEDGVAFVDYQLDEDAGRIVLIHAEVPGAARGKGLGQTLVGAVLDDVRERGLKVVPRCAYVAAVIRRQPAYHDLLAG